MQDMHKPSFCLSPFWYPKVLNFYSKLDLDHTKCRPWPSQGSRRTVSHIPHLFVGCHLRPRAISGASTLASELEIGNLSTVADEFVDPSHLTGSPYLWHNCLLALLYQNTAAATYDTVNPIAAQRSTRFQNLCVLLCHQWVLLWGYHLHLAHNIKYNTQMLYPNTVTNIKTLEPAAWMTG
jgi:hypothetical protein